MLIKAFQFLWMLIVLELHCVSDEFLHFIFNSNVYRRCLVQKHVASVVSRHFVDLPVCTEKRKNFQKQNSIN